MEAQKAYLFDLGDDIKGGGDGNGPAGSLVHARSTKYWVLGATTNAFTGETCYSDGAAVTVP